MAEIDVAGQQDGTSSIVLTRYGLADEPARLVSP